MQKRSFLTVVMFLIGMFMTGAYAQTHTVSGLVKDKEMGEPLLTSSLRTPKIFVKEFSYFLMPCH